MRIVNPSFGLGESESEQSTAAVAAEPIDWTRDPIVLFSNSKPNARELLEGLRDNMASFRDTDNIGFVYKDSAGMSAPPELIESVSQQYKGALLALGD